MSFDCQSIKRGSPFAFFGRDRIEAPTPRLNAQAMGKPKIIPLSCLVSAFDGASLSSDSKDALWDRFYTGSATTTEAVRRAIHAAIELSKKTWVLGIATPDRDRPSIHRIAGGNVRELVARVRAAAKDARRLLVCYEAGYDGFWVARSLVSENIDCRVLDPASIQVASLV